MYKLIIDGRVCGTAFGTLQREYTDGTGRVSTERLIPRGDTSQLPALYAWFDWTRACFRADVPVEVIPCF